MNVCWLPGSSGPRKADGFIFQYPAQQTCPSAAKSFRKPCVRPSALNSDLASQGRFRAQATVPSLSPAWRWSPGQPWSDTSCPRWPSLLAREKSGRAQASANLPAVRLRADQCPAPCRPLPPCGHLPTGLLSSASRAACLPERSSAWASSSGTAGHRCGPGGREPVDGTYGPLRPAGASEQSPPSLCPRPWPAQPSGPTVQLTALPPPGRTSIHGPLLVLTCAGHTPVPGPVCWLFPEPKGH